MQILVQKYGGSSLATVEQLRAVAERIRATRRIRRPVIVVVSARGRATDELLRLSSVLGTHPPPREVDQLLATAEASSAAQLAIVLDALGVPAASLTGAQAGVRTEGPHGQGRIATVRTARLRGLLRNGVVPVVAGFQGMSRGHDVATLGRGGSDTTAVALTAALNGLRCEICTDVDGVFTADPRIVRQARLIPRMNCRIMAEMAKSGARVLHSRSVELALSRNVEIHVRHATRPGVGSVLSTNGEVPVESPGDIIAVTHDPDTAAVSISLDRIDDGSLSDALDGLGALGIDIDLFSRAQGERTAVVQFTVPQDRAADTRSVLDSLDLVSCVDETVGKVSLVASAPSAAPGHPARALRVLWQAGIGGATVHTSQLRTSLLVPGNRLNESVSVLHSAFGLDQPNLPSSATAVFG